METWLQRCYRSWEQFWFRPADPTVLGLIRIGCGIIVLYTIFAYSFHLDDLLGPHGWLDLATRMEMVRDWPIVRKPWSGVESPLPPPRDQREETYLRDYVAEFKQLPPAPYPRNDEEMKYCHKFCKFYGFDLRTFGLPPPQTDKERYFLEKFAGTFGYPPAPPYPHDDREEREIFDSVMKRKGDPHRLLAWGTPVWSLWFYVTEPAEMWLLHSLALLAAFLFLIGFCTRITTVLTWFFFLNYVHRSPITLFGTDTMVNIVLLYLLIGPSGAALSVDRLIARRWSRAYQEAPEPSVAANFSIRLLQIHLCIIYLIAGLAKLKGTTWWNGTAVWGSLAHFEMAPINNPIYAGALRLLASNEAVFYTFLFAGTYFTLAFEISYAFLIWRPRFRLLFLAAAFLLHALIGVLMGLTSFALIMFLMNLAFLHENETQWLVDWPSRWRRKKNCLTAIVLLANFGPAIYIVAVDTI